MTAHGFSAIGAGAADGCEPKRVVRLMSRGMASALSCSRAHARGLGFGERYARAGGAMRVGVIGGKELSITRYAQVAAAVGCQVEFHDGHMAGRGTAALDALVQRCDLIVIVTQINSHAAVRRAQRFCRRERRPVRIVRRFGLHSFANLVQSAARAA
jgi:hypothetical protein